MTRKHIISKYKGTFVTYGGPSHRISHRMYSEDDVLKMMEEYANYVLKLAKEDCEEAIRDQARWFTEN